MKNCSVLVVEDEYYFRQALIKSINSFGPEFYVCGESRDGKEAFALIQSMQPDIALIDGNREKDFGLPVQTVGKGDSRSANIAAASVLAKVTRDMIMEEMAAEYPQYGFEIHKGYGTKAHYEALRTYGHSPIHRMSFLKKFYGEK